MMGSIIIKGNQKLGEFTIVPYEVIKKEWRRKINTLTDDGDLIMGINDLTEDSFEVVLGFGEKTQKKFELDKYEEDLSFRTRFTV
jgi:hypothetical protein